VLHGSENWIIKARDARRITVAEMKYMSRKARYTWTDYKTNTEIAKELNITPVLVKRRIRKKLVATFKQNAPL
jgi:DNA-binding Lrp family transcriptional regulator